MTHTRLAFGLALALITSTATAQTYDVKVNPDLNGLDITIEPVANSGVLVVKLTNKSDVKVRCNLMYQADPQLPSRSYVFIAPGKTESDTLRATQAWFSVTVNVECRAEKD